MTRRTRISQLFLRLFVTFLSFEAGAGLYETRVLIPLWSASPPETVRNWDSTLTSRSRQRSWKLIHPALILSAGATLATGWQTPRKHRRWLLVSTIFSLIVEVASLTYFVPTRVKLLVERGEGLTDEEISTKDEDLGQAQRDTGGAGDGGLSGGTTRIEHPAFGGLKANHMRLDRPEPSTLRDVVLHEMPLPCSKVVPWRPKSSEKASSI